MFSLFKTYPLGVLNSRGYKVDGDVISLCKIVGISNLEVNTFKQDIEEYKRKCQYTFINQNIPKPTYEDTQVLQNQIGLNLRYDKIFISDCVRKVFGELPQNKRVSLVDSLTLVFETFKNQGETESRLKNFFLCTIIALKKNLKNVLFGDTYNGSILFIGHMTNMDSVIFSVLALAGVDCVICDFTGKPSTKYEQFYFVHDGDVKDIDLSYLDKRNQNGAVNNNEPLNNGFTAVLRPVNRPIMSMQSEDRIIKISALRREPKGKNLRHIIVNQTDEFKGCKEFRDYLKEYQNNVFQSRINDWSVYHLEVQGCDDISEYRMELSSFWKMIESVQRPCLLIDKNLSNLNSDELSWFDSKLKNSDFEDILNDYTMFHNTGIAYDVYMAFETLVSKKKFNSETVRKNYEILMKGWMVKYLEVLYKQSNVLPVVIIFGEVSGKTLDFLELLSCLPVDIIIFNPFKVVEDCYSDLNYHTIKLSHSEDDIKEFPKDIQMGMSNTVAYQAERELDTLLYNDDLLFRTKQFMDVEPLVLRTTFDEIGILWNEPARFRPNFKTLGNSVVVPNIFAKINGVNEDYGEFLQKIKGPNTIIYENFDNMNVDISRIVQPSLCVDGRDFKTFLKSVVFRDKIDYERIVKSPYYRYNIYSNEVQALLLSKIKKLLSMQWCPNMTQNKIYDILLSVYSLPMNILQQIQQYDFTGNIPKIVYFISDTNMVTFKDSVVIMLCKLLGFDVLFIVPTGYNVIENNIDQSLFNILNIGSYRFDLHSMDSFVSNFEIKSEKKGFFDRFFASR